MWSWVRVPRWELFWSGQIFGPDGGRGPEPLARAVPIQSAPVAQLAARRSHNPKVASSILVWSISFFFFSVMVKRFFFFHRLVCFIMLRAGRRARFVSDGELCCRLDGRAVQGASLRHWSLRRRGFESHSNHTFRVSLVGQDRWLSPTRPGFDSRTRKFSFCSSVYLFFSPPERVLALAPRDAISSGSSVGRAWV